MTLDRRGKWAGFGRSAWRIGSSSTITAAVLMAAGMMAGCRTLNSPGLLIESAFSEIHWHKDGFLLRGSSRSFRYTFRRNREEGKLDLLDDYRRKATFIDWGMDGTVNEIRSGDGRCLRGAPGREALFAQADRKWKRHREELRIDSYVKKWREGGPEGVPKLRGVGSF